MDHWPKQLEPFERAWTKHPRFRSLLAKTYPSEQGPLTAILEQAVQRCERAVMRFRKRDVERDRE